MHEDNLGFDLGFSESTSLVLGLELSTTIFDKFSITTLEDLMVLETLPLLDSGKTIWRGTISSTYFVGCSAEISWVQGTSISFEILLNYSFPLPLRSDITKGTLLVWSPAFFSFFWTYFGGFMVGGPPAGPFALPPRTTPFILTPCMLITSLSSTVSFLAFLVVFFSFLEVLVYFLVPTMIAQFLRGIWLDWLRVMHMRIGRGYDNTKECLWSLGHVT